MLSADLKSRVAGHLRQSRITLLVVLLSLMVSISIHAQSKLLGKIDFPNSGASAAQAHFLEGVLYLHNFEYEDAARAFRRAQEADPDFVMAYWGETMTHNHPIWMRQDREAALKVLERLGPTPEARMAKTPTQREKDYLWTLETLYGNTERSKGKSKEERDFLYLDEMRRLHESYPQDHEAASFHGLAILGTAHNGRDFAIYMKAAAVLQQVWDENRKHPGAAHYLIHSYDDPIHAPLGLPMARVYAKIAPAAAHAQHMVSHIFVALGMWDDVTKANTVASQVQNARRVELGKRINVCGHYPFWLEYGYLQQGRFDEAAKVMNTCFDRIKDNPDGQEGRYFAAMRARYVLDTGDWSAANRWAAPSELSMKNSGNYEFTTAFAAIKRGDLETALRSQQDLLAIKDEGSKDVLAVLRREIQALLALNDGKEHEALLLLREAVKMEAELPYEFGPPNVVKPTSELLGQVLYELGRHKEAVQAFNAQLKRTPLRTISLLGLARASTAAGNAFEASEVYQRLAVVWHSANPDVPGREEAMKATNISKR